MHATTLGQLSQVLGQYTAPGQSFAPALNQALEAIYGMGVWRDLTVEGTFDCADGYFTLPPEGDTVLYAVVDTTPATVRSLWHDYRATGFDTDALLQYGLIDDGYRPVLRDIPENTTTLHVVAAANYPTGATFDPNNGALIEVLTNDGSQVYSDLAVSTGPGTAEVQFSPAADAVDAIRFEQLLGVYDLRTTAADPETIVATVGPGNGVARFRRYRVPKAQTGTYAHVLCKRRFLPVADDNDLVYISHTGALKHALLAVLAEDNADLERAQIHWDKCRLLLDENLDQYRGPARPSLDLQLYGDSVRPVRNHY